MKQLFSAALPSLSRGGLWTLIVLSVLLPGGRAFGAGPAPYTHKFTIGLTEDGQTRGAWGVAVVPVTGEIIVADTQNHRIQVFRGDGVFLRKFGSRGSGDGQLNSPVGVAVDRVGQIIVADADNHRIQVFSSDGAFLRKFGTGGSGDGQFNFPFGVAVNASGQIIVADDGNHRIQVFSSDGAFLRKFGSEGPGDGQLNFPSRVAVDASGQIIVADTGNDRIQVFSSDGVFLRKFGSEGSGDGRLLAPSAVAVNASGQIIVVDAGNHRIQIFSSAGVFLRKFGSQGSGNGQLFVPSGVAVNASGQIIVAESANHRVQVFASDGTFLQKFGAWGSINGEFANPSGVAVGPRGEIIVADTSNHRIQVWTQFDLATTGTVRPGLNRTVYLNKFGLAVDDFYPSPRGRGLFPGGAAAPDSTVARTNLVSSFENPVNAMAESSGVILHGYLVPPVTGDYTFYLCSDDQGELWLSTDQSPANSVRIASEPGWNPSRTWTGGQLRPVVEGRPANQSRLIRLEAGRHYYVEASMKEGAQNDNLGVAWRLPGGAVPPNGSAPISARHLRTASFEGYDVTSPGDPIRLVTGSNDGDESGPPPAGEGVENAIDNLGRKHLNFSDLNSGFIVTPSAGASVLGALRVYPANDAEPRDPASFRLSGSTAGPDGPFTLIAEGPLSLPPQRNTNPAAITPASYYQEVAFENDRAFTSYRLVFPTLKNAASANSMQIAEVELLGYAVNDPRDLLVNGSFEQPVLDNINQNNLGAAPLGWRQTGADATWNLIRNNGTPYPSGVDIAGSGAQILDLNGEAVIFQQFTLPEDGVVRFGALFANRESFGQSPPSALGIYDSSGSLLFSPLVEVDTSQDPAPSSEWRSGVGEVALPAGQYQIRVSLNNFNNVDAVFARAVPWHAPSIAINIQNGRIFIRFAGTLKRASEITGPFFPVQGSSPLEISPDAPRRFYIAE